MNSSCILSAVSQPSLDSLSVVSSLFSVHTLSNRWSTKYVVLLFQALENKPITIYGTGEQTRSFQYVSDLVQGQVTLMASDYILPVNIGNPEERSIKTFATLIREMVGCGSEIVNRPEVEDDPQKRRPDISTAAKVLIYLLKIFTDIMV